ncbi:type II toxin-antitoxin system PemK/MazF family toxin [Paenibacillus qinlingensis]|uniref:mRNA-degrading endonuclease toxin of MazEF toxin-antitoxin module n=1 Tax=Paenibacillus qinlingensis TaxID=1837343 RepID=A0ABU1P4I3_9BACL|nr:type II toxin-antitoxin system PemK/MazF family toxin [Paenibacillus qinlingensis]MDR6554658.1 mRNA-degrading endonuclease toxin of MazEF toxin-antitoxin module [Paenibacillus qinlingensis]
MFTIDKATIEAERDADNNKNIPPSSRPAVTDAFKNTIWNIIDGVTNLSGTSVYLMSHWILYNNRWIENLTQPEVTRDYKRGSIVYAELGAMNFRFEPSFEHPCIVLFERKNRVLVVPCSSKRYRIPVAYSDCINATRADGFAKPTGVQIENIRWIHKNRITRKSGTARSDLLNKIDQRLLETIPLYRKTIAINTYLLQDKSLLEADKASLQAAKALVDVTVAAQDEDIKQLQAKIKKYEAVVDKVSESIKKNPALVDLLGEEISTAVHNVRVS